MCLETLDVKIVSKNEYLILKLLLNAFLTKKLHSKKQLLNLQNQNTTSMKNTVTKIILLFTTLFLATACCNDDETPVTEKQGKVNIYIEGDITNEEAATKLEEEIGTLTENIYVQETTQLTDITINFSKNIRDIVIKDNLELKNIAINGNNNTINDLTIGNQYSYDYYPIDRKMENITINSIIEINDFTFYTHGGQSKNINCNDLITINNYLYLNIFGTNNILNFNKLKYINKLRKVDGEYSSFGNTFDQNSSYQIFNMPELEEVYNIENLPAIGTLSFPKLKKINSLQCEFYIFFQNLSLPQLERCKHMYLRALSNGTSGTVPVSVNPTINFPNLNYCETIALRDLQLDTNKINAILHHFLNVTPVSSKNVILDWNNAAPSGQGLIDKQTLINQGNNVLTN